jgi:hypothetical protein
VQWQQHLLRQSNQRYIVIKKKVPFFQKFIVLGESIFGWYHYEPPQGMVKKPKKPNHFLEMFNLNVFTTIIFSFFSCLSITCTNTWLEIYFGIIEIGNY